MNVAFMVLGLCRDCSYKVNYFHKRKEVTRKSKYKHKHIGKRKDEKERHGTSSKHHSKQDQEEEAAADTNNEESPEGENTGDDNIWKGPAAVVEEKSREEEFEEYLEDLFL